jgi:hypothetical protein
MKCIKSALLVSVGLMLATPAWAQPGRFYDPSKVVTIQGQVEKVETMSRPGRLEGEGKPGRQAQIVYLKTNQGTTVRVHLGPTRFLEQQQFAPKVGDAMTVTGSKLTTSKGEVILAAEVKSGGKTLTLRDAQGIPVWRPKAGCRPHFMAPKAPSQSSPPPTQ